MKLFVDGYISRESCTNCRFKGYSRVSDLTIGDFWGIWDIAPEMDDDKGTSVVLVQSTAGDALLTGIAHQLVLKPVTLAQASESNQAMLRCSPPNGRRKEVLNRICGGKISECEKWISPHKETGVRKLKRVIRALLGR